MSNKQFRLTFGVCIALWSVYVFWGGTYLAMRFAIETLPPFLMAGTRFLTAGLLLYGFARAAGNAAPSRVQWKNSGIAGALLLLGGNGSVVWAQQFVPSGMAAIVVATMPLWMSLFAWLLPGGVRPSLQVILGLLLGFVGIVVLMAGSSSPVVSTGVSQWFGYAVLTFAAISWSLGSLFAHRASLPDSPWLAVAMQMIAGGALLWIAGIFSGEWVRLDFAHVSLRSLLAFSYLVVFGSMIGFSAYIWLMHATSPALASTYAYVNPVIAVLLGWALAGERFSATDGIAAAIIVASVIIITRGKSSTKPA